MTPDRISVVITDDQEVVREGLFAILGSAPGIEVVGLASNGAEATQKVAELLPDVVLMDLNMPVMNGVQATELIAAQHPNVHVLVLTTFDSDEWVLDAIRAGAIGYLLKDTPRERLVAAIRDAAAGKSPIDPAVAGSLLDRAKTPTAGDRPSPLASELTERELDVLGLLGKGLSNADIAGQLFLSEGTVRNYVSNILTKLQVDDRTQAAVFAVKHGLS